MRTLSPFSRSFLARKDATGRIACLTAVLALACLLSLSCSPGTSSTSAPAAEGNTPLSSAAETVSPAAATTEPAAGARPAITSRTPGIAYPDPSLTPGDTLPVTATQVCNPGYAARVRAVSTETKSMVYAEYYIASHPTGAYEVDHLIALELGGSNDIKNLWPEPAAPRPGFHEKDQLENTLHALVCDGRMALSPSQHELASDWYAAYLTLVLGKAPSVATPPSATAAVPAQAQPAPTPVPRSPTPSPTPAAESDGHTWYTSAASNATRYYCDLDPEWKSLSPANLRRYPSEAALIAAWGAARTKSPVSHC